MYKPGESEAPSIFNSAAKGKHSKLMSSPKTTTVEDLITAAKPGDKTYGVTTQYEFKGGYKEALDHFDLLKPKNVKIRHTDKGPMKIGTLKDGRTAVVRGFSGTESSGPGPATLEIQIKGSPAKTKYRYFE
jgi:hypothetical protein